MDDLPTERLRTPLIVIGAVAVTALLMWGVLRGGGDKKTAAPPASSSAPPPATTAVPSSAPASPSSSAPAKPSKPPKATKEWSGHLTVTGISAFDLDTAPPARHDRDGDIRGDFLEPKLTTNGDVFNSDGAHISSVMSGSPGYDKCQAAASGGGDQTDKLSVGEVLCVQTDGGHVARLKVTTAHQTASDPVLKLDVTVWNAPGG